MEKVSIRCPACGRRLFDVDVDRESAGAVSIRCPRCKSFAQVDLSLYNKYRVSRTASTSASVSVSEPKPAPSEREE